MPGLIDIHTHGGAGHDIMSASAEEINALSLHKIKEGVTGFFPATITAPIEAVNPVINRIQKAISAGLGGANILGVLLEGPYIHPEYKGAHLAEHIIPIDVDQLTTFVLNTQLAMPGGIVNVTIAPELPNAIEAIQSLAALGANCCLGHTSATFEEAKAGVDAGATIATHTYNAMSSLHHRSPGMVGAVLTLENIYAEIICDLVHVHPAAIKLAVMAKGPERIILVTDSAAPAGGPDGAYRLGEAAVYKKGNTICTADGTMAGSAARLIDCVKNMYEIVGIPLADAVTMATASPAQAVGIYESVGSLEKNKNADIIAIDDDFNIRFVMVGGVIKRYVK